MRPCKVPAEVTIPAKRHLKAGLKSTATPPAGYHSCRPSAWLVPPALHSSPRSLSGCAEHGDHRPVRRWTVFPLPCPASIWRPVVASPVVRAFPGWRARRVKKPRREAAGVAGVRRSLETPAGLKRGSPQRVRDSAITPSILGYRSHSSPPFLNSLDVHRADAAKVVVSGDCTTREPFIPTRWGVHKPKSVWLFRCACSVRRTMPGPA